MADKEGIECIFLAKFRFPSLQIRTDLIDRQIGQIHRTDFTSFTTDIEFARIQIDSGSVERGQLGDTQARRVDAFDDRRIAFSLNRRRIDLVENPEDFRSIQKCHFAIFLFYKVDRNRIDGFVSGFPAKFQKSPKSDHIGIRCLDR